MIYDIIKSNDNVVIQDIVKGEMILKQGEVLNNIQILISGDVYISSFSFKGERIIASILQNHQFFGLMEAINGEKFIVASVIALSNCRILSVPVEDFLRELNSDQRLMKLALEYLTEFTMNLIKDREKQRSGSAQENILDFFYFSCLNKKFPVKISAHKEFLADMFGINIRTLYRYLNKWEKEGIIKREAQNIIIDKDSFHKIEKLKVI